MYFNILAPLILVVLFVTPLLETMIVPDYLSVGTWKVIRLAMVVLTISARVFSFREEV